MAGAINIDVSADRKRVSLTIADRDTGSVTAMLDRAALLKLIQGLGEAHSQMLTPADIHLRVHQVPAVMYPQWVLQPEQIGEAVSISFFHPRFGPMAFVLPMHEAQQISQLLQANVALSKQFKQSPAN